MPSPAPSKEGDRVLRDTSFASPSKEGIVQAHARKLANIDFILFALMNYFVH